MKNNVARYTSLIFVGIAIIVIAFIGYGGIGYNSSQNFQVIQSVNGNMSVNGLGGYYLRFFPSVWEYPKVNTVYFSNNKAESNDNDGVQVYFKNKGTGFISAQVIYRLYNDEKTILAMHEYARGDLDKIDDIILARMKEIIKVIASNMSSSEAIEKSADMTKAISDQIVNDKNLMEKGIKIEQFAFTEITFDKITNDQFAMQQKIELDKKNAEANMVKLETEKKEAEAKYAKEIAEEKGKAEKEMMKQVTDAERQKKLAEIEAQQKVEVEKLAAEEAKVKQQKMIDVAELEKKEAEVKAEREKEVARIKAEQLKEVAKLNKEAAELDAQRIVTLAEAKQKEIQLSGAITEVQKVTLEVNKDIQIGKAKAIAEGFSKITLPKFMIIGNGTSDGKADTLTNYLNIATIEKAMGLGEKPVIISETPQK
ncbi:MAG: hypothetical protein J6J11_01205 [Treponema sp.]|nr:hypothetical protein [Treponema sp.]